MTFVEREKVDLPEEGDPVLLLDGAYDVVAKIETVVWPANEPRPTRIYVFGLVEERELHVVPTAVPHSWREDRRER